MATHFRDSDQGRYGQIAGSARIDAFIYHCFEYLSEQDERKFIKKFREQPHGSDQVMHTLRELALGAYLAAHGLRMEHEYRIGNHTADWCIVNSESAVIGLVELTNFHIDRVTEKTIAHRQMSRGIAVYWRDGNKDNIDRLYQCILNKTQKYQALVTELRVPYIVSVFGTVAATIDLDEVSLCVSDEKTGLFNIYAELSGVLFFEMCDDKYVFSYLSNPNALWPIELPSSDFPSS